MNQKLFSPFEKEKVRRLHLEHRQQGVGDGVKVRGGGPGREIEISSEQLHP